jgi:hypothetical protein
MRRLHPLPLAVAGLAIVLASCGGQQFPQSAGGPANPGPAAIPPAATQNPRAWLLASVRRTSELKTARVALSLQLDGFGNESTNVTGDGAIDFAHHQASLAMRGTANGERISVDVRVVGGTEYSRSGGDWQSAPANDANLAAPNPATYLAYLRAVSADVHVEGHETLRGVDTVRYGADIDFDRALANAADAADRKEFLQARTMLGGMTMPTKVWIDGDGHLRKLQLGLDLGKALRQGSLPVTADPKMTVAIEFYDFGIPIQVVPPSGAIDPATFAAMRTTQSDLRNALVAEKVVYTDRQSYSADPAYIKQIESSLDWGNKMRVVVGAAGSVRGAVVCLSATSVTGRAFSIADVAAGPDAGTYYGRSPCPAFVDDASMARLGPRW